MHNKVIAIGFFAEQLGSFDFDIEIIEMGMPADEDWDFPTPSAPSSRALLLSEEDEAAILNQLDTLGDLEPIAIDLSEKEIQTAHDHQYLPDVPRLLRQEQLHGLGINGIQSDLSRFTLMDGAHRFAAVRLAGISNEEDYEKLYIVAQVNELQGKWLIKLSRIDVPEANDKHDPSRYQQYREEMKARLELGEKSYLLLLDHPVTVSLRR